MAVVVAVLMYNDNLKIAGYGYGNGYTFKDPAPIFINQNFCQLVFAVLLKDNLIFSLSLEYFVSC